jgi:hypothetical protein
MSIVYAAAFVRIKDDTLTDVDTDVSGIALDGSVSSIGAWEIPFCSRIANLAVLRLNSIRRRLADRVRGPRSRTIARGPGSPGEFLGAFLHRAN